MTLYIPPDLSDLPLFPHDPDGAPSWFITGFPHGGMNKASAPAGPKDKQCRTKTDGLRCDRIDGHFDKWAHRASWDDGAFTLVWGGSI